jgi:hypothetical protein
MSCRVQVTADAGTTLPNINTNAAPSPNKPLTNVVRNLMRTLQIRPITVRS